MCEASGWAHICDEGCREKVVDSASGLMVCPISGRSFDRLMTEREVRKERGGIREVGRGLSRPSDWPGIIKHKTLPTEMLGE